jgi:hypothetical protein
MHGTEGDGSAEGIDLFPYLVVWRRIQVEHSSAKPKACDVTDNVSWILWTVLFTILFSSATSILLRCDLYGFISNI